MRATIVLLALLGVTLAAPKQSQRIVGGSPTTVQEYPFLSNMLYGFYGITWHPMCGGTLITTTVVVSAAHCYIGDWASEWRARLGSSLMAGGGSEHHLWKISLHPDYDNDSLDADVALLYLSQPAVLSASVQPASIAGPNYIPPDGSIVTAIGWGSLSSGGIFPDQLQHVAVNVINQELCADRYERLKTQPGFQWWPDVTAGMLCSGVPDVGGKGTCLGDNGGPLVHSDVLVGVVSWGYGCADPFYPAVSARVSHYSDWIVANA